MRQPNEQLPNYSASPDFFVGPIGILKPGDRQLSFLGAVISQRQVHTNIVPRFEKVLIKKKLGVLKYCLFFHHKLFGATNIGLLLGDCIVNVVIFVRKYFGNLFRISFNELIRYS